jgi:two-component system response regulator NreC
MSKIEYKIILADDHQIILDGIAGILKSQPGYNVLGTANSGIKVLELLKLFTPDLIISDVEMPGLNGIELLKIIKSEYPGIKIIMLTMYKEANLAKELLNLDTDGYILKTTDQAELLLAVNTVLNGKKYISPELSYNLLNTEIFPNPNQQLLNQLTERELEILILVSQGYSNKEIAETLFISPKTVDNHRTNMMAKLNIHNIAGLTRFAIQNNLV